MSLLLTGLALFFAVHSISIGNDPWRERMVQRLGIWTWKGIYSLIALAGLVLMIKGYGPARVDPATLYLPARWLTHLAMLLMLPVFPLLLATYFPGRIKAAVGHPMLLATILWAFSHLLVNGSLADVLLFGAFLAWAFIDLLSATRRTQRPLPGAPESKRNDVIAVIGGLVFYAAFVVWLHAVLLGVPLVG